MVNLSKKQIIIFSIILMGLPLAVYVLFFQTTKIKIEEKKVVETKVETKVVKEKVYVDRVIHKLTKPDGTIEETTTESDRSTIDSSNKIVDNKTEEVKTLELINPKFLTLGLAYKENFTDFNIDMTDYQNNIGIWAVYDTGVFNTSVFGAIFYDRTAIIGLGVKL